MTNYPTKAKLKLFAETNGAISLAEGVAIHYYASLAPEGKAVELGSHAGKAATMAAAGFLSAREFHLVDPCYSPSNKAAWAHTVQEDSINAWHYIHEPSFNSDVEKRILKASDGKVRPVLHGDYSIHAIQEIEAPFAYCMIDSNDHAYQLCHDECELLRPRMAIGGIICYHDLFSQFHGVEQAYREMLQGGAYEEVPTDWPAIIEHVKGSGITEETNCSWHHRELEFPQFVGAIRRIK